MAIDYIVAKEDYDEYMETIEELKAEVKELNDDNRWWSNRFNAVQRDYENTKNQLQQKENIIKEVREYIKDACYLDEINYPNSLGHKQTMKLLEILDKENI